MVPHRAQQPARPAPPRDWAGPERRSAPTRPRSVAPPRGALINTRPGRFRQQLWIYAVTQRTAGPRSAGHGQHGPGLEPFWCFGPRFPPMQTAMSALIEVQLPHSSAPGKPVTSPSSLTGCTPCMNASLYFKRMGSLCGLASSRT